MTPTLTPSATPYEKFLGSKRIAAPSVGIDITDSELEGTRLFDWQRQIVLWALRKGKAALFCDCGMGKTPMQLEWGWRVHCHTGRDVLILAPLAVAAQTVREGVKFGIPVTLCRTQADVRPGINITNYEMLDRFTPGHFVGVVLDESSILKSFTGQTKQALLRAFSGTAYRLCCTATPAPNDHLELGNHADFLGVMPANEMIMRWFINDTMSAGSYRLKKHAEKDYWRWVSSWAVSLSHPSDIGYSNDGFILPPLHIHPHIVDVDPSGVENGELFRNVTLSATTMHKEMRLTAAARAAEVAAVVAAVPDAPWVIWCNTNYEAGELTALLPGAVEVRGSEPVEAKERKLNDFTEGRIRVLISKSSICGFGMNWQHCRHMAFVGLSYSFEQFYQALRRSWRFGQSLPVEAYVIYADTEGDVLRAIQRKQKDHEIMKSAMCEAMREVQLEQMSERRALRPVEEDFIRGQDFGLHLGDACEITQRVADNSLHFSVYSPPFSNLYIYSDSEADMGNSAGDEEFFAHYKFLIPQILRATIPGRLSAVHCKDLPMYKGRDDAMGLRDFPGDIIKAHEACISCGHDGKWYGFRCPACGHEHEARWIYHSRVTIWKDPVIEMQRTKNHGLLYKNLRADSCGSRQGMADYLVMFRKWTPDGAFMNPVPHTRDEFPLSQWQKWASPVWMDIDQTKVLNYQIAREGSDEKHICPLQLDVIERAIGLWSSPGEIVFTPFAGIGSEMYQSLLMGRRPIGIELKRSYFEQAVKNCRLAESQRGQTTLFDFHETEEMPVLVSAPAAAPVQDVTARVMADLGFEPAEQNGAWRLADAAQLDTAIVNFSRVAKSQGYCLTGDDGLFDRAKAIRLKNELLGRPASDRPLGDVSEWQEAGRILSAQREAVAA